MSWRDYISNAPTTVVLPWLGGGALLGPDGRTWMIRGGRPPEHCWGSWTIQGHEAAFVAVADLADARVDLLRHPARGYLVGDRIITDSASAVGVKVQDIAACSSSVYLLDPGLDRFTRVRVARVADDTPYVFTSADMPLGPEDEVLAAFLDGKETLDGIRGVPPALDLAFRLEVHRRREAERRRMELERARREGDARRAAEEQQRQLMRQIGDGAGRRALAKVDFGAAIRAALIAGGATLLDWRPSAQRGEYVVRYRFMNRRLEFVCDAALRVIDSGVCLTDHRTGAKGDTWLTAESLPGVIAEAIRDDKLVVYRNG